MPPVTEDEIPFDIPETWEWVRLGNIIQLISGQDMTPDKYNRDKDGVPYLTGAGNIEDESILINRWTLEPKSITVQGDLLITCKGTVGTMAFMDCEKAHIARQIMAIRTSNLQIILKFLLFSFVPDSSCFLLKFKIPPDFKGFVHESLDGVSAVLTLGSSPIPP